MTSPLAERFGTGVLKIRNFQALYQFEGYVVDELICQEVLKEDLPPPDLDYLRTLLVDEKAVRRGHNYVTIVLNGDTGEPLYMAEGKKREILDRFFEQLTSEQKSRVEAVGIDRSGTYQSSIQAHLPEAAIVYDRLFEVSLGKLLRHF